MFYAPTSNSIIHARDRQRTKPPMSTDRVRSGCVGCGLYICIVLLLTTHVLLIRTHSEQQPQQQQQHTGASHPGYIPKLDNGIWSDTRRSLSRVDVCFMHCEYMRYWKVFCFVLWFAQAFWGQLHAAWQYCMNTTSSMIGTGSGIRSVTYSIGHSFGLDNDFFIITKYTTTINIIRIYQDEPNSLN